jgi:dTDP-glucose pyrophosphorylase
MTSLESILLPGDGSVRRAIKAIEVSREKIALVVDADRRLLGTVTDGDIRRAILRGVDLDDPVNTVMNAHPTVAHLGQSQAEIIASMRHHRLRHMPVVDENRRVVRVEVIPNLLNPKSRDNVVVLMAGGRGQRLRPLTEDIPKSLLRVGGKPILEVIVEELIEHGFRRFVIAVNYKREMVESHFGNGSRWGVSIAYLREEQPLGTAGALSLISEVPQNPLVVMNGDILTKVDFDSLLAYHTEHRGVVTTAVREYGVPVPYGVVDVEGERMVGIREKPVLPVLVNAGVYVVEPDALSMIPAGVAFDMPDLFQSLLAAKRMVAVFPIREYWIDIGQMDDFQRANGEFDRVFR